MHFFQKFKDYFQIFFHICFIITFCLFLILVFDILIFSKGEFIHLLKTQTHLDYIKIDKFNISQISEHYIIQQINSYVNLCIVFFTKSLNWIYIIFKSKFLFIIFSSLVSIIDFFVSYLPFLAYIVDPRPNQSNFLAYIKTFIYYKTHGKPGGIRSVSVYKRTRFNYIKSLNIYKEHDIHVPGKKILGEYRSNFYSLYSFRSKIRGYKNWSSGLRWSHTFLYSTGIKHRVLHDYSFSKKKFWLYYFLNTEHDYVFTDFLKHRLNRPLFFRSKFLKFPIYFRTVGWDLAAGLSLQQTSTYFDKYFSDNLINLVYTYYSNYFRSNFMSARESNSSSSIFNFFYKPAFLKKTIKGRFYYIENNQFLLSNNSFLSFFFYNNYAVNMLSFLSGYTGFKHKKFKISDSPIALMQSQKDPFFITYNWHLVQEAQKIYWPGLDASLVYRYKMLSKNNKNDFLFNYNIKLRSHPSTIHLKQFYSPYVEYTYLFRKKSKQKNKSAFRSKHAVALPDPNKLSTYALNHEYVNYIKTNAYRRFRLRQPESKYLPFKTYDVQSPILFNILNAAPDRPKPRTDAWPFEKGRDTKDFRRFARQFKDLVYAFLTFFVTFFLY